VKRYAPATARNREPILAVLRAVLPPQGTVLEIASGTGEHAIYFARALPQLTWQPSDPSAEARASISAWAAEARLPNLRPPIDIDTTGGKLAIADLAAVVAINMVHISPWSATEGLVAGAAKALTAGGVLLLYGPYQQGGRHTAPSNAAFDAELRAQNAAWGVRDLEAVTELAANAGLALDRVVQMPANNLCVAFRRLEVTE
jgi:hypothetical protein